MPEPKLLDKVREELRSKHFSKRTEAAYTNWIKRFDFLHLNQNLRTEQKNILRDNITMIYTHVLKTVMGVKSPIDDLI